MKRKISKIKRLKINRRVDVAPSGGLMAMCGYYSTPVQKTVRRWKDKIADAEIEQYVFEISNTFSNHGYSMTIKVRHLWHWQFIGELTAAYSQVFTDKTKSDYWLLTLSIRGSQNGVWPTWDAISAEIKQRGGGFHSAASLAKAYQRLKLATPPHMALDYLESSPYEIARTKSGK